MIRVSLSGTKALEASLKKLDVGLTKGIEAEIKASAVVINAEQKQLAPVDFGVLRSSLKWAKVSPLFFEIVSTGPGSSYAPYQEFGTGGLATIPAGLEAEAALYKGSGKRNINMRAQPFFFAPAFREWKELVKRIEIMLKK